MTLFFGLSLLLICLTTLCNSAPWDDVPECRQVHESGYAVPNCPGASECYKEAHEKAQQCILEELKDKNVRKCQRKPDIQSFRKEWFKASCRWHSAVSKCMAGESVDSWQQDDDTEARFKRWNIEGPSQGGHAHHEGHGQQGTNAMRGHPCWRDIHNKIEQCKEAGAACEHYKVCTGEEEDTETPDDSQAQWFSVVRQLKTSKSAKTQEYRQKIRKCLETEKAESSSEGSNENTAAATATTTTPENTRVRRVPVYRKAKLAGDSSESSEEAPKTRRHIEVRKLTDSESSADE